MKSLEIKNKNFVKNTKCPICKSVNFIKISNIKHNIKQLNGIFDFETNQKQITTKFDYDIINWLDNLDNLS